MLQSLAPWLIAWVILSLAGAAWFGFARSRNRRIARSRQMVIVITRTLGGR